jgi:DNA-directed RNA polymerase specialized sigma subunit
MRNEQEIILMLKNYDYFKSSIAYLETNIVDIIETGLGVNYSKPKLSKTNKFNSSIEIAILQIDKLNIYENINKMKNTINAIDKAMEVLNEIEKTIISQRCIKNQYYYEFCYKICVSERTAKRLRKQALDKMSLIIFGGITNDKQSI